jgi:hypothetical protein
LQLFADKNSDGESGLVAAALCSVPRIAMCHKNIIKQP